MKNLLSYSLVFTVLGTMASCGNSESITTPAVSDTLVVDSTLPPPTLDAPAPAVPVGEDLGISAGTAGVWVENAANVDAAGADIEAAITLCEGGRASYAVFSNQLFVFMNVSRHATPEGDVFSFYYDSEDAGSGFRNTGLKHPKQGALLGTGRVEGEGAGVLIMDWRAGAEYIASIRAATPKSRTVFPQKFYHNFIAMAGLCEETE